MLLTDAVLRRVDRVLDDGERSSAAFSAAIGDLSMLLGAWLPGVTSGAALAPIARRVVERTLHPAFAGREAVLAALTGDGPEVLTLLGRLPKPRRIDAWRRSSEVSPNPVVGLRKALALALAPACPFPEVALEVVAWTFRLPGGPGAAPLDEVGATLDALGEAGEAARAGLRALADQSAGRLSPR